MHITTSKEKNVRIISIDGKVDSFTSKDFQNSLINHIIDGETILLVDCAKVEYISSSGIRAFYFALRELKDSGSIGLCSINENILHTLELVDFTTDFSIYNTLDEAIKELS